MTLIVGMVDRQYALQVSDRNVTAEGQPWDPASNKTIVMLGSDGYVTLSYTGVAYIGRENTDECLAELMSGHSMADGRHRGRPSVLFGPTENRVGLALRRLKNFLQHDFARRTRGQGDRRSLRIQVCGFLGKPNRYGRGVRPYMASLCCRANKERSHTSFSETGRLDAVRSPIHQAAGQWNEPEVWQWWQMMRDGGMAGLTDAGFREDMRALIERVSMTNATVGADCMAVYFNRSCSVNIAYMPQPSTDDGRMGYTPWLIGAGIVAPPLQMMGSSLPEIVVPRYGVLLERVPALAASSPSAGFRATLQSQPRVDYRGRLSPG